MPAAAANLIFACAIGLSAAALPPDATEQLIVVRGRPATRGAVQLVPGDRVATLSVDNPPPRLLEILRRQTGPVLIGVERIDHVRRTTRVALRLKSEAFGVRLRRLPQHKGAFSIKFTPKPVVPGRTPFSLIGRVPHAPPQRFGPVALPRAPKRHPCRRLDRVTARIRSLDDDTAPSVGALTAFAKTIENRACSDFFVALIAVRQLKLHRPLTGLDKWAYTFSRYDRWPADHYAYSYVALVAAAVLLQSDLAPEAEALLMTDRMQVARRLIPFRALLVADHYLAKSDVSTAQRLLKALLRQKMPPSVREAAAGRLVDLASKQDREPTRAEFDRAIRRLPAKSSFHGEVLLRAGELALDAREPHQARRFFATATKSALSAVRSHAFMRLGDLAIHTRSKAGVRRALQYYDKVDRQQACFAAMTRLRQHLVVEEDRDRLEHRVMEAVTEPVCRGHELDALYAMSELSRRHDRFVEAMALQRVGGKRDPGRPSIRRAFARLGTRISTDAVGRHYRNRDWHSLVELHQGHLSQRLDTLTASSRLMVAEALNRAGLYETAAHLLRRALETTTSTDELDRLTLALAQTYLAGDKLYLAEVVLEYFRRVRSRSEKLWAIQHVRAELFLRQDNGAGALQTLASAEKSTPSGDPMARLMLLRAEANYQLKRSDEAALALISAMQGSWHPPLTTRGLGVNVSSLCVRACKAKTLERLLKVISEGGEGALLSERIRYLSTKRGVGRRPKLEDGSVWERLEAVAPEIRVGPRRGKRGSR